MNGPITNFELGKLFVTKRMKFKVVGVLAVLFVLLSAVGTSIYAQGHSPDQLDNGGWFACVNAGPNDWIHCLKSDPTAQPAPPSIPVKVFDDEGDNDYLGTELLIRADLYNKDEARPCPQEGEDEYELVQLGPNFWRACHHF
jgi:hypothetical protein